MIGGSVHCTVYKKHTRQHSKEEFVPRKCIVLHLSMWKCLRFDCRSLRVVTDMLTLKAWSLFKHFWESEMKNIRVNDENNELQLSNGLSCCSALQMHKLCSAWNLYSKKNNKKGYFLLFITETWDTTFNHILRIPVEKMWL